jgi:purine-nucleoside/S-methyl-5'-thioadenosine phosphorylase / adenosine deaminase
MCLGNSLPEVKCPGEAATRGRFLLAPKTGVVNVAAIAGAAPAPPFVPALASEIRDLTSARVAAYLPPMHGNAAPLKPIEAPPLKLPGVAHAFFTRQGGVSDGIYHTLNTGIGSKDSPESVLQNRTRAARFLGTTLDRLATPYQVHSSEAVAVEEVWAPGQGPKADAVVTRRPGVAVGVGSADCGPVLFADAEAGVVAAAHAGWKGALAGILESTLATMERLGAKRRNVVAVLGPTISAKAYEVGPEFSARFVEADAANRRFFHAAARDGHSMFDLPAYIVARLEAAGIGSVGNLGLCTYSDEERFYSYRRATHRGENGYGRLLSAIALIGD